MSRTSPITLATLAACIPAIALATGASRLPDGSGIPEITQLHQTFNATTLGASNAVASLDSAGCNGFSAVQGPDVVYTWLAQTNNPMLPLHLDFYVSPQAGFDAVVYALSELDNGASCVAAVDNGGVGEPEMLHLKEQLTPGQRYYLYVDSRNSAAISGGFTLLVGTFIPVELQSFSIE